MAATPENLGPLADLIEAHRIALPAIHTLLYHGRRVLLEWYDAMVDDPIYVASVVPEPQVRRFAEALKRPYRWERRAA